MKAQLLALILFTILCGLIIYETVSPSGFIYPLLHPEEQPLKKKKKLFAPPWIADWFTQGANLVGIAENGKTSRIFQRSSVHVTGKGNFLSGGVLKWQVLTGSLVYGGAMVGDINGDGLKEAIFGSEDMFIHCVDVEGNLIWKTNVSGKIRFSFTIFDIDGDNKLEVLAGSYTGSHLTCLNYDGTIRWQYSPNDFILWSSPAVYDIDGDGRLEILFGSKDNYTYCLDNYGNLKWKYLTGGYVYSSPCVGDIDNDGKVEILVDSNDDYIYCLNSDGSLKWKYLTGGDIQSIAICDVDNDGLMEVLGPCNQDKYLYCLESDGTLKWRYLTGEYTESRSTAAYDIDGDGIVECFITSMDDKIHCVKGTDGTEKWTYTAGDDVHTGACIADIDADGLYEVMFGCNDKYLYCVETNGDFKWKYLSSAAITGGLSIADIDNDGLVEIFFGSGNYMYCLTS